MVLIVGIKLGREERPRHVRACKATDSDLNLVPADDCMQPRPDRGTNCHEPRGLAFDPGQSVCVIGSRIAENGGNVPKELLD